VCKGSCEKFGDRLRLVAGRGDRAGFTVAQGRELAKSDPAHPAVQFVGISPSLEASLQRIDRPRQLASATSMRGLEVLSARGKRSVKRVLRETRGNFRMGKEDIRRELLTQAEMQEVTVLQVLEIAGLKCRAARSPSSTVPEPIATKTMLIRFCATTLRADVEATAGGLAFFVLLPLDLLPAPLRFAFWDMGIPRR
jgi:hypothetical protein